MSKNRTKALRYDTAAYKHPNARNEGSGHMNFVNALLDMLNQRTRDNRLAFLTPDRCRELFEHFLRGEMAEVCFTFQQMALFDDDIFVGLNSRLSALDDMPWRITIKADAVGKDKKLAMLAEQQRAYLQDVFAKVDNLEEALRALGRADFDGVAALELTGTPGKRMVWEVIEPYMLARPVSGGAWLYNPEAAPTLPPTGLQEMDEERVIIREAPPILLPAMFLVCCKIHGVRGWAAFLDKFGIPSIFAEMPVNCSEEERAVYDAMVQRIVGEGSGTVPGGTKFQTVETRQNSADSYRDYAQWCKEAIITLCTGGLLTVAATADTGALAGGAHSDSLARLCRGSARGISAAVNSCFTARLLREKFGYDTPILARFELAPQEEEDKQQLANIISTLAQAGFRPSAATVSEMMGFEVAEVKTESAADPRLIYATAAAGYKPTLEEMEQRTSMQLVPLPDGSTAAPAPSITNTAPTAAPATEPPLTAEELALLDNLRGGKLNPDRIRTAADEAQQVLTAAVERGKAAAAPVSPA